MGAEVGEREGAVDAEDVGEMEGEEPPLLGGGGELVEAEVGEMEGEEPSLLGGELVEADGVGEDD